MICQTDGALQNNRKNNDSSDVWGLQNRKNNDSSDVWSFAEQQEEQ